MLAIDAIKFTFKNFKQLLPYYITPFLLVTLGGVFGFSPLYVAHPIALLFAIVGLFMILFFFWGYIVKGAGVHSLVNGLLGANQLLPFDGVDNNIKERAGKCIKFLFVLAILSILVAIPLIISGLIFVSGNVILGLLIFFASLILVVWFSVKVSLAYPAFVFNDFDDAMGAIKYSFEITKGNEGRIIFNNIVMSLILQFFVLFLSLVPALIFAPLFKACGIEGKDTYDIMNGIVNSFVYFTAMPILATMLYREFGGEFTHPDWQTLENSQNS